MHGVEGKLNIIKLMFSKERQAWLDLRSNFKEKTFEITEWQGQQSTSGWKRPGSPAANLLSVRGYSSLEITFFDRASISETDPPGPFNGLDRLDPWNVASHGYHASFSRRHMRSIAS